MTQEAFWVARNNRKKILFLIESWLLTYQNSLVKTNDRLHNRTAEAGSNSYIFLTIVATNSNGEPCVAGCGGLVANRVPVFKSGTVP